MIKTKMYFPFLCLMVVFSSCEIEEETPALSNSEFLVQQSPWNFKTYELIDILDIGDSMLTIQQIENEITNELTGVELSFYADGTGFSNNLGEDDSEFIWQILDDNQLRLDFTTDGFEDIELYENLLVSFNELRISSDGATFDSEVDFNVLHFGTLVFD